MHLKGLLWIEAEIFRWQLHPSGLGVMRVQIDHNHDDVTLVVCAFAEAENLRIIDRIEAQVAIALESAVFVPDPVDAGNKLFKATRLFQIPSLDLIFFRIEIFFAAGFPRHVFTKLKGRAVNAVVGAQHRGQHQPGHEGRPSAKLEILGQDIRSIRPQVGAEKIADLRLGELGEILDQFRLRVAPGKIGVGLAKAQLGQAIHDLSSSEGLRQEEHIRISVFHLANDPLPKRKRFGMRVVGAENPHTLLAPEKDDVFQLAPKLLPVFGLKVYRIDVLILFRGIFRVLDRSVRTFAEPLRMFRHIGMIRRTLKGDVQGDFDVKFFGFRDEALEIRQ